MPRAFLFKKKRKAYFRSHPDLYDFNKNHTEVREEHLEPPHGQALLQETSGRVSDDVIKVPFFRDLDKAENVTACTESDTIIDRGETEVSSKSEFNERTRCDSSSSFRNATEKLEIPRNWMGGRDNEPDLIKIFGDHEKEFHLKFASPQKIKSAPKELSSRRRPEAAEQDRENKLRSYLESFNSRTNKGDDVIRIVNPWALDNPSLLYRRKRDPSAVVQPADPSNPLDFFLPADLSTSSETRNNSSPPPAEKWMMPFQEKASETTVGSTKEERSGRIEANVLSSLYQSYFYSANYYNSLHFRAWRNAQHLRNQLTYSDGADFKEPFSSNGRSHLYSSIAGYPPTAFSEMSQLPTEKVKPSPSKNLLRVPPMGKSGARQPVPGVEYVKNTVNRDVPPPNGDLPCTRESRDDDFKVDDRHRGVSLNGFTSGSGGTDVHVPTRKRGQRKEVRSAADQSGSIARFTESTLKTILTPPAPQTYRGGRRSVSGKPPQPRKYVCDVCGKAFSRSNTLVTHKRIHTGDKPFACELCGRAFRQPGNLTRHRLTHTTVKPYACSQCGKAFNRASNLHTHMRTHTNYKPFICQFCGKGFHQKIDMKIHSYTHTGEKPHKCKKCGRGFKQLTHLTYHMRTHSEVKMYTCNYCGKGFNQKGNLQAHIYRHTGERPHRCDICNKGFTLASTLNTHRRTHAEKKPYVCQHCGKDFYQKSALRSHLLASHPYSGGDSLL